jgi:hypothetical protein
MLVHMAEQYGLQPRRRRQQAKQGPGIPQAHGIQLGRPDR